MNLIGLFFILRFFFYTYVPYEKLSFGGFDNPVRQFDLFFMPTGMLLALGSAKSGTTIKRLKELLFITPLFLIVPLVAAQFSGGKIPNLTDDGFILLLDVIFLLYSVIFSFTLGFDFAKNARGTKIIHAFTSVALALGITSIYLSPNTLVWNIIHTVPFILAVALFTSQKTKTT